MDSASSSAVWEYWREYWAASQRLGFWLQLPRIIYSVTLKFGALSLGFCHFFLAEKSE